jgi:hypothetical protein
MRIIIELDQQTSQATVSTGPTAAPGSLEAAPLNGGAAPDLGETLMVPVGPALDGGVAGGGVGELAAMGSSAAIQDGGAAP